MSANDINTISIFQQTASTQYQYFNKRHQHNPTISAHNLKYVSKRLLLNPYNLTTISTQYQYFNKRYQHNPKYFSKRPQHNPNISANDINTIPIFQQTTYQSDCKCPSLEEMSMGDYPNPLQRTTTNMYY